jgi:hypothetical protein
MISGRRDYQFPTLSTRHYRIRQSYKRSEHLTDGQHQRHSELHNRFVIHQSTRLSPLVSRKLSMMIPVLEVVMVDTRRRRLGGRGVRNGQRRQAGQLQSAQPSTQSTSCPLPFSIEAYSQGRRSTSIIRQAGINPIRIYQKLTSISTMAGNI